MQYTHIQLITTELYSKLCQPIKSVIYYVWKNVNAIHLDINSQKVDNSNLSTLLVYKQFILNFEFLLKLVINEFFIMHYLISL